MNTELVRTLTATFEGHAQKTESGVEYWLARDLQVLLGYAEWRNFTSVIDKAKTACDVSDRPVPDHFVEVNKMVDLGSGSQREVDDLMLTRVRPLNCPARAGGATADGAAHPPPRHPAIGVAPLQAACRELIARQQDARQGTSM